MTRTGHRRPPRRLLLVVAAGAVVLTVRRHRRRAQARDDGPADLGFMRAIHAGLRRDAARLQALAPQLERGNGGPRAVLKGWATFRQTLEVHHAAEDDDLWPVLRSHLTETDDLHQLDLMVAEHRSLTAAIQAVDAALASGVGVTTAAQKLGDVLGNHLDHEEQQVFPLLERHLSRGEWRRFLVTERRRRSARERPEFLTWVLDNASDQDTAAVLAELPRPAHLVYRRLLRPRYQAQRRWPPA
jgi:hemerythrin-like domain-containing protein